MAKPKGESRGLAFLRRARPKAIEHLLSFFAESARNLDPKTRFLISLVTKVISGSERGVEQYVRRALESGAGPEEVIDAVLCAYPCAGLTKVVDAIDVILDMGIPGVSEEGGDEPEAEPAEEPAEAAGSDSAEIEVPGVVRRPPPVEARPAAAVSTKRRPAEGEEEPEEAPAEEVEGDIRWAPAGQVVDVPPVCGRRVIIGTEDIAIFRVEDEIFAVDNRCPHRGGSLSEGVVADGIVVCPLHQWRYRLGDGQCPDRPRVAIRTYPVRIEGDQIFVGIPAGEA